MLQYPALFPRRRIAKRLPEHQAAIAEVVSGRRPADTMAEIVFSLMSRVLGHANECLFDSTLLACADDVFIPGGEDETNRFITEVLAGDRDAAILHLAKAMRECRRHRVWWLLWVDEATLHVAHVFGEVGMPSPFLSIDLLLPNTSALVEELYPVSFEGMLAGALHRAWKNAQRMTA
jgi:hypothetical protein